MADRKLRKPKLGDIVEIETPRGLAYIQYTARGKLGDLVRILPGFFQARPASFKELGQAKELYFTFYPVTAPTLQGLIEVVSHEKIPDWARGIPRMRRAGGITNEGKVRNWWIEEEDGYSSQVETLTPEQEKLSVEQSWSHGLLVHRLVQGWLPKDEGKGRPPGTPRAKPGRVANDEPVRQKILHYLYFSKEAIAQKVAAKIRGMNHEVEVQPADENNWLVLVQQTVEDKSEISAARDTLEALAEELKGDYDGFEIEVLPQTEPPTVN